LPFNLPKAAGLAGVATLISRVLGLARDAVLAALFGAGNDMDAFNIAFRVPNLVRDLFAEGAMSAAATAINVRNGIVTRVSWTVSSSLPGTSSNFSA
jgi:putative peptidoglycan lipid II flippase